MAFPMIDVLKAARTTAPTAIERIEQFQCISIVPHLDDEPI